VNEPSGFGAHPRIALNVGSSIVRTPVGGGTMAQTPDAPIFGRTTRLGIFLLTSLPPLAYLSRAQHPRLGTLRTYRARSIPVEGRCVPAMASKRPAVHAP
jgi:hypothetical protein